MERLAVTILKSRLHREMYQKRTKTFLSVCSNFRLAFVELVMFHVVSCCLKKIRVRFFLHQVTGVPY